MKKLFNKLSNSGNLKDDMFEDEYMDNHVRKPTILPPDAKDTSQDIKAKRSFSLSKATSPRLKAIDSEEFSKKKSSSSGVKKEKDSQKDILHESDDKLKKSKSAKTVSIFKSADQVKNPNQMRSPSLKGIFMSPYEQQKEGREILDIDSDSEDDDAFVPSQSPTFMDEDFNASPPIRVPSAPARMATSPTPISPNVRVSPTPISPNVRASSPSSPTAYSSSPSLFVTPGKAPSPFKLSYSPPPTPVLLGSPSPTPQVLAFTQAPPSYAVAKPTPHVIVADELDTKFDSMRMDNKFSFRERNDSITDDFGVGHFRSDAKLDSDSENDAFDDMDTDMGHHKKGGLFSFGSNKSMKLKA